MKHANLDMPKTYKTFAELAEYAKQRAKISAARRSPQDFEYWESIYGWALHEAGCDVQLDPRRYIERWKRETVTPLYRTQFVKDMAQAHARAIHCRIMLKNRGEKVPRLSLKWLREAAERL